MTTVPEQRDIQGNILRPYRFTHARYLLVAVPPQGDPHRLLWALLPHVTSMGRHRQADPGAALNVAVTHAGFARFGMRPAVLDAFPAAFRAPTRDRAALLGDVGPSAPETWTADVGTGEVHLLVTLHGATPADLDRLGTTVDRLLRTAGARTVETTTAQLFPGKREHFGFADGAAQPDVEGVYPPGPRGTGGGVALPDGRWRQVRLGEFVLGYPDEDGVTVTAPDPALTRNGSYLVFRKLEQDVALFRENLECQAAATGLHPELLAAKLVGRWRDGTPLVGQPERDLAAGEDLVHVETVPPANDFRYLPDDVDGEQCPVGAHIRRTNPRDALTFGGVIPDAGRLLRRHRIIRRGMPYGTEYADGDTSERGLVFVCFNADIARQFETIQTEWCLGGNAFGLGADPDYLLAADVAGRTMTIPRAGRSPLYVDLPDRPVVITRGSEYLFAPGLSALRALADGAFG